MFLILVVAGSVFVASSNIQSHPVSQIDGFNLTGTSIDLNATYNLTIYGYLSAINWSNVSGSHIYNDVNWENITNITASGFVLNNTSGWTLNFSNIYSNNWSNVTITEIQIIDLQSYYLHSNPLSFYNSSTIPSYILTANEGNLNVNSSDYLGTYDASYFMPLNTSVSGNFDFNGGWMFGGLSIIGGDIYAQTGYFYNISSLSVTYLNINGSLLPTIGFDNTFDIGNATLRWKDLYLSGELRSNGTGDNYFLGNVGIGTASPQSPLTIESDSTVARQLILQEAADPNHELYLGWDSDGDYGAIQAFKQATGAMDLVLQQAGGNVGIGTTTPGIDIVGTYDWPLLAVEMSGDAQPNLIIKGTVAGVLSLIDSGGASNEQWIVWYNEGGTTALQIMNDDGTVKNTAITVDNTQGNVGIGTASPGRLFEVENLNADPFISIRGAANNNGGILFGDAASDAAGQIRYDHNTDLMGFATAGTSDRMVIDGSGDIGIGTSNPAAKLHIEALTSDTVDAVGNAHIVFRGDTENVDYFKQRLTATGQKFALDYITGGTWVNAYTVDRDGHVGIGTSTPAGELDVNGDIFAAGSIVTESTAPIANAVRVTGEYMFTEGNELDYTASFGDGTTGTVTFTELPANTIAVLVRLEIRDTSTNPSMDFKRSSGGTLLLRFSGLWADGGANLLRMPTVWIPTSGNTLYKSDIRADNARAFHIIGYKVGE